MITIKKKNIYKSKLFSIRLIKKSDTNGDWYKWFNDKKITKFMDKGDYKNTRLKQINYFKKIDKSKRILYSQFVIIKVFILEMWVFIHKK